MGKLKPWNGICGNLRYKMPEQLLTDEKERFIISERTGNRGYGAAQTVFVTTYTAFIK